MNIRPRDIAEHIRLAAAARAGTGAAKALQREIRLDTVVPSHRKLIANQLHVL